ncbi:Hypothetical Protein FCC1311_017081 [Hondaea fermentalgiana]|uniref:Uncharacterized protein n=1 Tax=Hondaea fermentalgiana TaxID=2315210 RepID=A0A2R5GCE1_9STRA|nr:Hypothetical Protein FCC1311_017081 [Hondaea fermentalgiana]|eukprot:GBG28656.1 Hypothetical Protein FCC1311_017081 [Hondaea fermentalgiana]
MIAGPVDESSLSVTVKQDAPKDFASFPDEVLDRVESRPGTKRRASIVSRIFSNLQSEAQHKSVWITGILFLAENPGIDKLRNEAGSRLLSMARFRSVIKKSSFTTAVNFMEIDPAEIDMNYHFQTILDDSEKPPSREDVYEYVSGMYDDWLPDLSKPLWQILIVPQTQDGGAAVVTRISHIIGDGVSQVEVLMRLIDAQDEADAETAKAIRPPEKRKPKKIFGPLKRTSIFLGGVWSGLTAILNKPDPPNSLCQGSRGVTTLRRKFAFTEKIPLDRIKVLKNKLEDSTINDVLILMLNETLRRYFEEAEETAVLNGGRVTAQFPISTRARGANAFQDDNPCNSMAYGYLKFHFEKKGSMLDRFWRMKRDIDKIKHSPGPKIQVASIRALSPALPRSILNMLALGVGDLATGQLSNIAAPQKPVHIAGARVDDMTFVLFAPVALYLGLLSYNGQVNCSVCLDGDLDADPKDVVRHWGDVFADFEREVLDYDGDMIRRPRFLTDAL